LDEVAVINCYTQKHLHEQINTALSGRSSAEVNKHQPFWLTTHLFPLHTLSLYSQEQEHWMRFAHLLISALDKLPRSERFVCLFRGVTIAQSDLDNYTFGRQLMWKAFSSTSEKMAIASQFTCADTPQAQAAAQAQAAPPLQKVIFSLHCKSARPIEAYSPYGEAEWLLPPGVTMRVTSRSSLEDAADGSGGGTRTTHISLEEVESAQSRQATARLQRQARSAGDMMLWGQQQQRAGMPQSDRMGRYKLMDPRWHWVGDRPVYRRCRPRRRDRRDRRPLSGQAAAAAAAGAAAGAVGEEPARKRRRTAYANADTPGEGGTGEEEEEEEEEEGWLYYRAESGAWVVSRYADMQPGSVEASLQNESSVATPDLTSAPWQVDANGDWTESEVCLCVCACACVCVRVFVSFIYLSVCLQN
jgi:hypothetical protein